MKLPRDLDGRSLIRALKVLGYEVSNQSGSHIRLTTQVGGQHHVTVPDHSPLRTGTPSAILSDVAAHHRLGKIELLRRLFD